MDAATPRDLEQLDSEALKSLILSLQEQVFSHRKQLTTQQEEILLPARATGFSRRRKSSILKLLIAKLRRMQFGRSSEKLDRQIEQLELRLEELQTSQAEKTAANTFARPAIPNQPVKAPVAAGLAGAPAARNRVSICHSKRRVRTAAEHCTHWVKTYAKSWSTSRCASK